MDTTTEALVAFGPAEPYTDHQITGSWQNARTWIGNFTITPLTGDGWHTIYVGNARGQSDYMEVTNGYLHKFEIVTSGTAAMNLQANGGPGYVDLSWTQDSFDLLGGYNIYRSDTLGGTYSRINTSFIPRQTKTYRDTNVQANRTYYYKFTVVKTDMTESNPSNIASAAATVGLPAVTTTAVTSITTNSAQSGGNITSDGGAAISSRGVCWSTTPNPTIANSKTTNGTGTGSFTSSITGLTPGTPYHVRAYATNSAGTGYGSDVSFTTSYASTRYVCSDGDCGGQTPCHKTVREAVDAAGTGTLILIAGETHDGGFSLNADKSLTLQGGWDTSFKNQTGTTTLQGAPKAPRGSLTLQNLNIKP